MGLLRRILGRPANTPHAEALHQADSGVAIYWRPGCPYSIALTNSIRRYADRAAWVDIWKDPDGATYVRSVNGGNELVPTVVINGVAHPNPAPTLVRSALKALEVAA